MTVAIAVALASSGCAGTPAATTGPSPTATSTPTPTSAGVAAPAQVFGGDCSSLYSATELGAALGTAIEARPRAVADPSRSAVANRGGLECLWSAQPDLRGAYVDAVILSSTDAGGAGLDETYCYGTDAADPAESGACSISITAGAFWLSGVVYTPLGTTNAEARAAVASLVGAFQSRATTAAAPEGSTPMPARWTRTDCSALSESAQVLAAVESPALVASDADTSAGESPEGQYAAVKADGVFACGWFQDALPGRLSSFGIEALPGGAWVQDAVALLPGAQSVAIPGVERVIRVPLAGGGPQDVLLNAFDGVNWLQLSAKSTDLDQLAPAVPALIAALNADADGLAG